MTYLIGIVVIIGLSVWLWGEAAVKKAIKIILLLALLVPVFLIGAHYQEKSQKEKIAKAQAECLAREEKAYEARPTCPRAIVTYQEEEKAQCRIDWRLQNDEGIKAKTYWDLEKFVMEAGRCSAK